jgi:hypothetical protein
MPRFCTDKAETGRTPIRDLEEKRRRVRERLDDDLTGAVVETSTVAE